LVASGIFSVPGTTIFRVHKHKIGTFRDLKGTGNADSLCSPAVHCKLKVMEKNTLPFSNDDKYLVFVLFRDGLRTENPVHHV
jgi:hypothetical protein